MVKISIICHDAGGAENIANWAIKENNIDFLFFLEEPALSVFKKYIPGLVLSSYEDAIRIPDIILLGTSWESNLEKKALIYGKRMGKYIISFLDHWVNYKERFFFDGRMNFPNELWVVDEYAINIAKGLFPNIKIKLKKNYYLENIKNYFKKIKYKKQENNTLSSALFLTEPIKKHSVFKFGDENYYGYNEESAINFFLENLHNIDFKIDKVKIRPHPSEETKKYNWLLNKDIISSISSDKPLINDIAEANLVVGCETMAMVVALSVNKTVISSIPPKGRKCSLPHPNIIHLKDII